MSDAIATTLITGVFALGGVYLGTLLNSLNESKKSAREIKIRAFTKLASLKLPLTQSIQTNIEAQLLWSIMRQELICLVLMLTLKNQKHKTIGCWH